MIQAKSIIESISDILVLNERNIINQDELDDFLKELSKETSYHEVREWIQKKLRLYLLNVYPEVDEVPPEKVWKEFEYLPKWLPDAIKRGDKLYRIDVYPQPAISEIKRVVQCMDQLHDFSLRDFQKMVKAPMDKGLLLAVDWWQTQMLKRGGVEETGITYPGGYRWVTLHTEETIEYEGEVLGNCLKRFADHYYKEVKRRSASLYSLRDSNDKPKAHIEVNLSRNEVAQMKGYGNGKIDKKYWRRYCYDLIERGKYTHVDDAENIGAVWDNGLVPEEEVHPEQATRVWVTAFMRLYEGKTLGVTPDMIDQLLGRGVNIEVPVNHLNATALMIAVHDSESPELVDHLIKKGANLEARDKNNNTPFMYVALSGDIESAEKLLDAGADINAKSKKEGGDTPLILAVARGHYDMVRWLFEHDVDYVDDIDELGKVCDNHSMWDILAHYGAVSS